MKIFEHTFSTLQSFKRDIVVRVALPDNYNFTQKIPFMLLYDAQNFFDTWSEPETKTGTLQILNKMFSEGFPPLALVGIDTWKDRTYLERFTDLSPWESNGIMQYIPSYSDVQVDRAGGRGEQYADFIVHQVIPFVEKSYSIGGSADKRGIAGSSMGAMAGLYTGTKYNEIFSRFGFLSPALWCFKKEFTDYLTHIDPFKSGDRIYMDIGRKETSDPAYLGFEQEYLAGAYTIFNLISNKTPNIMFAVHEDGEHNMPSIAKHLPQMFRYLWHPYA